jgi:hypothetical protein
MVAYPALRRMADATRTDPALVNALDRHYKILYGSKALPWSLYTAGQILGVVRLVEMSK